MIRLIKLICILLLYYFLFVVVAFAAAFVVVDVELVRDGCLAGLVMDARLDVGTVAVFCCDLVLLFLNEFCCVVDSSSSPSSSSFKSAHRVL